MRMHFDAHCTARACALPSINIYWRKTRRRITIKRSGVSICFAPLQSLFTLHSASLSSPHPPGFAVLTRPTPSLPIARSSCAELAARARASMYVFIDVTRDGRTQLTARKQRMHREYTSVFRACLWHPLGAERRSRFLYSINPGTLCIQPESFTSLHQRRYFLFSLTVSLILNHRELWSPRSSLKRPNIVTSH